MPWLNYILRQIFVLSHLGVTRSHAAVVEADGETMQLSIVHGSVVYADDASASLLSMATHLRIHTRITRSRRGGPSQAQESEVASEWGGARTREHDEVKPCGERCHGAT